MSDIIKDTIELSQNIASEASEKVNLVTYNTIDFIQSQLNDFITFLVERKIIEMSIGFILATQINKITTIIMELFINPIINRLSFGKTKKLRDLELDLFEMNFKIGIILENIINLFIILIIIFYIWKLTKNTDLSVINNTLDKLKPKLK